MQLVLLSNQTKLYSLTVNDTAYYKRTAFIFKDFKTNK